MQQSTIDVSKKVNGKYEKVGEITIHVPMLHELFPEIKIATDKEGKELVEDGLPVYEDGRLNWVQGSIVAAVKAQARNKLVSGTATVKAGQKIAENWDELTAEGERTGNPEALAAIRDAKADFAKFVGTLGKSQNAATLLNTLFGNKTALQLQTPDIKNKMVTYLGQFLDTLNDEQVARYTKYLESLNTICEAETVADDF